MREIHGSAEVRGHVTGSSSCHRSAERSSVARRWQRKVNKKGGEEKVFAEMREINK